MNEKFGYVIEDDNEEIVPETLDELSNGREEGEDDE